jgi:phasin
MLAGEIAAPRKSRGIPMNSTNILTASFDRHTRERVRRTHLPHGQGSARFDHVSEAPSAPRSLNLRAMNRLGPGSMLIPPIKQEDAAMGEPKLEVPAELRDLAEKTIDQAEKAFGMFFDAANKSVTSIPGPGTAISRQALSFTQQNMKAAFEHARKLVHATDLQQAMQIQSEFLRSQFTNAGEHMRQITGEVMSAAKEATKPKS